MSQTRSAFSRLLRAPGFRLIVIGVLVLLLMIPLFMVWALVAERESRARDVQAEIAQGWGGPQNFSGPYLVVPFRQRVESVRDGRRETRLVDRFAVFLPKTLTIDGEIHSKELRRSIYRTTVYEAQLAVSGRFAPPDVLALVPDVAEVRWEGAVLVLLLSNVSGLKEGVTLRLGDGAAIAFAPSPGLPGRPGSGIHARIGERARNGFPYAFDLRFTGSASLEMAPAGRQTEAALRGDWPHPGFYGAFLPEVRKVGPKGFSARWRVPHLARSVPQAWVMHAGPPPAMAEMPVASLSPEARMKLAAAMAQAATNIDDLARFGNSLFGVRLHVPVDHYRLVERALKYGLMFLATVFGAVFIMELKAGARVHAVQYLLVGLMLVLFYVLLLSLAEHVGFLPAYVIAAAATGGVLSLYLARALDSRRMGLAALLLFAALFALLYMILRMEDHALLAGAVVAFLGLTAAMFLTLKVNWWGEETPARTTAGTAAGAGD